MNVLVVKLSSLGDVVHTFPALTDASRARRDVAFDWVVEEAFHAIAALHPAVRRVTPIAIRRWRHAPVSELGRLFASISKLRSTSYDLAIDAQGLLKSAIVSRCARANATSGYDRDSARESVAASFYRRRHRVDRNRHAIERTRALFALALDYPRPQSPADFGLESSSPSSDAIALLHGTTWPSKRWPERFWHALAERASRRGLDVIIPAGDAEERERAGRIAAGNARARVLPPLPLEQLVGELRRVRAAVSVDSGLGQLAAALGVPTVALYGPTDPALTGCVGARAANVAASFPCAPCRKRACGYRGAAVLDCGRPVEPACFASVTVDGVFARLERVL